MMGEKPWWVYILLCKDNTLYTGCTDDVSRRLSAHNAGKGAKYTRGRAPLILAYSEQCENRAQALRREIAIKKLTKEKKQILCAISQQG